MEKHLPPRILEWLKARGLSENIIQEYQLAWNGTHIVIPVHDAQGNVLFNKYRRDPEVSEGPKYLYEKGSTSQLYGLKTLRPEGGIHIVEGEMDALCLLSKGIQAVSSTGGAGTWNPEWNQLHFGGRYPNVCYDYDEAGIKGALHVASFIPKARIVLLPKEVGEHGDVTDFFVKLNKVSEDFLTLEGFIHEPISKLSGNPTKKELNDRLKEITSRVDGMMERARMLRNEKKSDRHLKVAIEIFMKDYEDTKKKITYMGAKKTDVNSDRLARAKEVPISQFIEFNRQKYAKCIWHADGTPSMFWYEKQNRVKCFGCGEMGDVIDVVKKLNSCGVKEAIEYIIGYEHKG